MEMASVLKGVCERLKREYAAHTVLLYGSMADGSANTDSDLDIAAFAPVDSITRIAELHQGVFVDAFVYPESVLASPDDEHLRFRGAKVLVQIADSAEAFLQRLDARYAAGPTPLPPDEITARRVWAKKMLARAQRGDVEGNYRRAWLLTALLEDYFHLRGLWFEGPKKAFTWLHENDPATLRSFDAALKPDAPLSAIDVVVACVVRDSSRT